MVSVNNLRITHNERRAVRIVHILAQCSPSPGNPLDETLVSVAKTVSAAVRADDRARASRSGIPLTRNR